jgi:hypothetical protein
MRGDEEKVRQAGCDGYMTKGNTEEIAWLGSGWGRIRRCGN